MKIKLSFLLILLSITILSQAQSLNIISNCWKKFDASPASYFDALYLFDNAANAGIDAANGAHHLQASATGVSIETTDVISGNAVRFDGTGALENHDPTFMADEIDGFTVGFWIKPSVPVSTTDYQVLFEEGGSYKGISLILQKDSIIANFVHDGLAIRITAPYPQDGEWHHIMLSKKDATAILYIDASIMAFTHAVPVDATTKKIGVHESNSAFGARHSSSVGMAGNHANPRGYKGLMDEIFYVHKTISNGSNFLYNQCASPNPLLSMGCDHRVLQSTTSTDNSGMSWFLINLMTGEVNLVNKETHYMAKKVGINSIGYSMLDGFIYGTSHPNVTEEGFRTLSGLDKSGHFVTRYVALMDKTGVVGDVFDGIQYLYMFKNNPLRNIYTYDINPGSANYLSEIGVLGAVPMLPNGNLGMGSDWAFNHKNSMIYTINTSELAGTEEVADLIVFNPTTGASSYLGTVTFPEINGSKVTGPFGGLYFDSDGYLYALNNTTGTNWRINVLGDFSRAAYVSESIPSNSNDGARCSYASTPVDFGDAPDASLSGNGAAYLTTLLDGGPRHFVPEYNATHHTSDLMLGSKIDIDLDGIANVADAKGDDNTGVTSDAPGILIDDEDAVGVLTFDQVGVSNATGTVAKLMGWIDINANGTFEANEQAYATVPTGKRAASVEKIRLTWTGL